MVYIVYIVDKYIYIYTPYIHTYTHIHTHIHPIPYTLIYTHIHSYTPTCKFMAAAFEYAIFLMENESTNVH